MLTRRRQCANIWVVMRPNGRLQSYLPFIVDSLVGWSLPIREGGEKTPKFFRSLEVNAKNPPRAKGPFPGHSVPQLSKRSSSRRFCTDLCCCSPYELQDVFGQFFALVFL
jgi:hypothetical protein